MPYPLSHSLYVVAHSLPHGRCTQTHIWWSHSSHSSVGVVALLTWELGQHIIYGASGEVTLTLNMVAKVTQVIIRRRGRSEILNHLIAVAVDEGRRWHIITLLHDRRENPMLDHLITVAVDEGRRWHIITRASKDGSIILARHRVAHLQSMFLDW